MTGLIQKFLRFVIYNYNFTKPIYLAFFKHVFPHSHSSCLIATKQARGGEKAFLLCMPEIGLSSNSSALLMPTKASY